MFSLALDLSRNLAISLSNPIEWDPESEGAGGPFWPDLSLHFNFDLIPRKKKILDTLPYPFVALRLVHFSGNTCW